MVNGIPLEQVVRSQDYEEKQTSTSTLEESSESPSESQEAQEGPQPLPPPRRRLGRPPGSRNKKNPEPKEPGKKPNNPLASQKRPLPETEEEQQRAFAPYRMFVRPAMSAVSEGFESFDLKPLSPDERESGVTAFSALLYEHGGEISASLLVGMWIMSIGTPRALDYFRKRKHALTDANIRAQAARASTVEGHVTPGL